MRRRLLSILLFALLLSGCSTITIVYNQADYVLAWMADDYFDLTAEQKDALRAHLIAVHAWHRSDQLPEYITLLESTKGRISRDLTPRDIDWAVEAIKARYRTIVLRWHGDAARILATITDEQLGATRRQFEKANRKFAKEYGLGAAPQERQRLRVRRTLERIEHWTGALSPDQEARIAEFARSLPAIEEARQQYRLRRQQEFLALMAQRRDANAFMARLREWLHDWEKSRSPQYEAAFADYAQRTQEMYLAIHRMLTPEQRERVAARLQRYIDAARQLARDAPRSAAGSAN